MGFKRWGFEAVQDWVFGVGFGFEGFGDGGERGGNRHSVCEEDEIEKGCEFDGNFCI